jgi:predicted O-linked N-acetylglucosamine transferase (SPINDLY family)
MADAPGAMFQRAYELHRQGQVPEALAAYDELLRRWPAHAETLHYSGVLLYQSGRLDDAVTRIQTALQSDPRAADAWCNLALVFQAQARYDRALHALNEALRYEPRNPVILNNLVGAMLSAGRAADAERMSRRALALDAGNAASLYNMALCQQALGKIDEALSYAEQARQADPTALQAAGLTAQLQEQAGQLDAAGETLGSTVRAIEGKTVQRSTLLPLLYQYAQLLERQGRPQEASTELVRTLDADPGFAPAISDLLFLRKQLADWRDLDKLRAHFGEAVRAEARGLSPFNLLSGPSTRAEQRRCAENWSNEFPALLRPQRLPASGRLKIGYICSDFRQHATAVLAGALFESHDRLRFDVFGYSTGPDDGSAVRARVMAGFDRFIDAHGWAAQRLASQIAGDGVDVLIDLNGHAAGGSMPVLAMRPAPVQAHYLGYPGTLGTSFIDYLIGDPVVTPPEHAADYAEHLVRLPACYQINDRTRAVGDAPPREQLGLPDDAFVFCCFNQTYKLNPAVLDSWARILSQVPRAVLWLLKPAGSEVARISEDNLRREARARGIEDGRMVFAARRETEAYLGLYRRADLFLDTWPYNAHTTASDALWAGCPLLTWKGETFAGRVAASLLSAVGLPELIAASESDYVARAVALADSNAELARYRLHLASAGRASPLFDTEATVRALEEAYREMAAQARSGLRAAITLT